MASADGNIHLSDEVSLLRESASNPDLDVSSRVEAYEDIIASEVGDTTMVRARNTEREVGIRQLYLKFEGGNPTGTQKDRIAFAQVSDALRRGYDTICFATCGNYGAAVAIAAYLAGIRCLAFIPKDYHTNRTDDIGKWGGDVRFEGGDYEESVEISSLFAYENEFYDANPGAGNTSLQIQAYGQIAYEIYDELRDAPAAVAVPVSNGTTLAGIYRGFEQLYRRGKTSHIPRIIAGSSARKNAIVHSFKKGLHECADLEPGSIHESAVNEPLINWHSIDGQTALDAIYRTGGWAEDAGDRKMMSNAALIKKHEGLSVLPASTAGLIALMDFHHKHPLPGDRYVAVLTGRR